MSLQPKRQIPSLREYLLVAQHRPRIERLTRGTDDRWTLTDYDVPSDTVRLRSIDCTLALAEVYDKVDLGPAG